MFYKLTNSVVRAVGTSLAYKSSSATSCSTVESTSSTTKIEIVSEEHDFHYNFWLRVFFIIILLCIYNCNIGHVSKMSVSG